MEESKTFKHHVPGDTAKGMMADIRNLFTSIEGVLNQIPPSREKSLAMTNLEQAAMWANKAVVKADPESVVQ